MALPKRPLRHTYKGWTFWQARRGYWICEHPTKGREWHHSYDGCKLMIRQLEAGTWSEAA